MLAAEGIGYSVHETTLAAGTSLRFEYEHQHETVYCVSGEGGIEDLSSGRAAALSAG